MDGKRVLRGDRMKMPRAGANAASTKPGGGAPEIAQLADVQY